MLTSSVSQGNESYHLSLNQNLRTLSTNNANNIEDLEGFLYVPSVNTQPCASTQYIPTNATRRTDILISQYQYNLVAFVPWISADCTRDYLAAANYDDGVAAFITYVPDNSTDAPPPVSDTQWGLNDGGRWKSTSQFPVYAISGASGYAVMQQLPNYSGNISTVTNSSLLLAQGANPTDFIRMYVTIQTKAQSNLPSLWAFLLIVLGIVLFLVACTSSIMHLYQRRARHRLRDRIARGEVDLEALGIKRLTVPQEVFDKLPVYTYTADQRAPMDLEAAARAPPSRRTPTPSQPSSPSPGNTTTVQQTTQTYNQTVCVICLEDYVHGVTAVAELPCKHIFHLECIRQLLINHSSLCPVCKLKVLPNGYTPEKITNLMVRRERQRRRSNGSAPVASNHSTDASAGVEVDPSTRHLAVGRRMASFHRQFGRAGRSITGRTTSNAPVATNAVEMTDRAPSRSSLRVDARPLDVNPERAVADRTERARRRIPSLLGHEPTLEDEEQEQAARRPKC